jgi:mannose-6-phosphate isomerase-like protein (cupin superfamily)
MVHLVARAVAFFLVSAGFAPAFAQAPPPLDTTVSTVLTPKDIAAAGVASRTGKPKDQMTSSTLFAAAPYRVNVEHRIAGETPPSIHERNAELFFVVEGEGVFITGGELVDPVRRNATNIAGTSIKGGQSRAVSKGDVVFVPAGTPHMITGVKTTLTMIATHLPNTDATKPASPATVAK